MKMLPREILNLFPMWEFQCPKCGEFLGYELIDYCVKCGTAFSHLKARVPPRILKNEKAMSEYAHKFLMPKLSPEKQKMLAQYFTVIFSDGFESGNLNLWDAKDQDAGCTCDPTQSNAHHGSWSLEATIDNANELAAARKYFSGYTTVFLRFYAKAMTLPPSDNDELTLIHMWDTDWNNTFNGGLKKDGANINVYIEDEINATIYESSAISISAEEYHCYEFKVLKHASAGEMKAWYDRNLVINQTGLDTARNTETYGRPRVGQIASWYASTAYIDCVIFADVFVGMHDTKGLSSTFIVQQSGLAELSSTFVCSAFYIIDVQVNPDVVVRSGVNTTQLRCDWHDEADLAASAYYCAFWVREPDNSTTYGPYKGSVTKEGSKEYNATYDVDPLDGWALGDYDVKAEVYK